MDCREQGGLMDLCNARDVGKFQEQINKEFGNQIFLGIHVDSAVPMTNDKLASEIEMLIRDEFDGGKVKFGR